MLHVISPHPYLPGIRYANNVLHKLSKVYIPKRVHKLKHLNKIKEKNPRIFILYGNDSMIKIPKYNSKNTTIILDDFGKYTYLQKAIETINEAYTVSLMTHTKCAVLINDNIIDEISSISNKITFVFSDNEKIITHRNIKKALLNYKSGVFVFSKTFHSCDFSTINPEQYFNIICRHTNMTPFICENYLSTPLLEGDKVHISKICEYAYNLESGNIVKYGVKWDIKKI